MTCKSRLTINIYIHAENIARENIKAIRQKLRKEAIKSARSVLKMYGVE